jgi:glycosyltransferase involved in cell wall biosynthesis
MKILCVIDSLGSGGAQRQMVNLACGLKAKGHIVELFLYFPDLDFLRSEIDAVGIPVYEVTNVRGFSFNVIWRLAKLYRSGRFDGVISFLDAPNIYAELAKLLALSGVKVVASERSSFMNERKSIFNKIKRWPHMLANYVVANSYTHADWLRNNYWIGKKIKTIYNGYSLRLGADVSMFKDSPSNILLLILGRIDTGKNGLKTLQALALFYQKNGYCPTVLWAGRQEKDPSSLRERNQIEELLTQNPEIANHWLFLDERRDVADLLKQADGLIHVSLYEGLPNAVCEAFVAARPVIASNVCDHPKLVEDGIRGIMCDPLSPESICEAMERFVLLPVKDRQQMGRNARAYAEQYLTIDRMVADYEALILDAR